MAKTNTNVLKHNNKGFTFIEILMVVFLLGLVTTIGVNLFFSILKGASKAEVSKEVKQNGDYAISVMERMIHNAQSAQCCADETCSGVGTAAVQIRNPDRQTTEFFCDSGRIASKSGTYLTSDNVYANLCSFSCAGSTPEMVTISFTLSQGASPAPARGEERASLSFQTKVSLRTY